MSIAAAVGDPDLEAWVLDRCVYHSYSIRGMIFVWPRGSVLLIAQARAIETISWGCHGRYH